MGSSEKMADLIGGSPIRSASSARTKHLVIGVDEEDRCGDVQFFHREEVGQLPGEWVCLRI